MKKSYELTVLFSPESTSDELQKLQNTISKVVTAHGGKIEKTEVWGRKLMAYRIKKFDEAFYVVYTLSVETQKAQELEQAVKLTDGVLRHLFIAVEEE